MIVEILGSTLTMAARQFPQHLTTRLAHQNGVNANAGRPRALVRILVAAFPSSNPVPTPRVCALSNERHHSVVASCERGKSRTDLFAPPGTREILKANPRLELRADP